jgi:hypothetical protein
LSEIAGVDKDRAMRRDAVANFDQVDIGGLHHPEDAFLK